MDDFTTLDPVLRDIVSTDPDGLRERALEAADQSVDGISDAEAKAREKLEAIQAARERVAHSTIVVANRRKDFEKRESELAELKSVGDSCRNSAQNYLDSKAKVGIGEIILKQLSGQSSLGRDGEDYLRNFIATVAYKTLWPGVLQDAEDRLNNAREKLEAAQAELDDATKHAKKLS